MSEQTLPQSGERIDDLMLDGLRIIQNPQWFCFGVDAVFLSDFAKTRVRKGDLVVDLCCGCGVVPILLSAKTQARGIIGVELQPEVAEMAARSVCLNESDGCITAGRVKIMCADLRNKNILPCGSVDVITCNPPYKEAGGGIVTNNIQQAVARHEIECTMADVAASAARLLRFGGRLCLIHRPERLAEIFDLLKQNNLEPKRVQMIHPSYNSPPTMVLIEAMLGARPKLVFDSPIFVEK